MKITCAILTVSDSCHTGEKEDKSGPTLEKCVSETFPDWEMVHKAIVPDEVDAIQAAISALASQKCNVILTTGGTGLSPRDVTPDATKEIVEKEVPGISHAMLSRSLLVTDMAMLSRAFSGIKDQTLIINMPGSSKAAKECFDFVKHGLKHAIHLITDDKEEVCRIHHAVQSASGPSRVVMDQVASRDRHSPYEMIEVQEAIRMVMLTCTSTNEIETVKIENCLYRILAEDVHMPEPFPRFRASIMDGYAVKYEDGVGIRTVRDAMAAGDDPEEKPLEYGEVTRINTGAAVPPGANAVVPVEDTELVNSEDGGKEVLVKINVAPGFGQDIREIGSDIKQGELVLHKFHKIKASQIGVLATIGRTKIRVFKRPSIGVLSTGNELQKHDEVLRPGHIRDSNKLTLLNLLAEYGYEGLDCGIARDEPECLKEAFVKAMERCDVIVTSGGVSMGEFDLIKEVLSKDFEATIHFGRINMKPGKPTTFASCFYNDKPKYIFGLPGNPVSATVTSLLFVIPAVRRLENQRPALLPHISVTMNEDVKLDHRPEYRRVRLEKMKDIQKDTYLATSTGNQISSRLNSFVGAHALAMIPSIEEHNGDVLKKGSVVHAMLLDLGIPFSSSRS